METPEPMTEGQVAVGGPPDRAERGWPVPDPILFHLHQAKQSAQWFAQLMQLDPELMIPAALPLVAARLMGAGGVDDDPDEDLGEAALGV